MEEFTEFSALHLWGCEFFVQLIPDQTGTSFPHLSEHSKDTMKCEMLEHPRDSADIHLSEGHLRSRLFPICIWGQAPQGHPNQPPPSPRSRNDCRSREGGALGKALPAPGAGGIPVWQSGRENHRGFVFTVSTAHSNYCSPPWLLQHYFILDLSHRQSLFITQRGTPRHTLSRQRGREQQDRLPPRHSHRTTTVLGE